VALCQARISTKPLWGFSSSNPYHSQSRAEHPEKEVLGLSPNFHIHVSVSDLYIPTIGPPIFLLQNRQTDRGNT
jgi:hypothetical protein